MIPRFSDVELLDAITWLTANTNFPTFDEFRKNPDKWRLSKELLLESADQSTQTFRNLVQSQKYQWKDTYTCDSLEQLERVAKEEGFAPDELEMEPLVRPVSGTSKNNSVEIVIRFWPKDEFKLRGGVVANE